MTSWPAHISHVAAPPNLGLGGWPARRARISPDRVALSQDGRDLTYAQLTDRTARLATVLVHGGVRPGDRVAYLGANDVATFETMFAAALIGAVFVPLNTRLAGPEINYMLADCSPTAIVHSPALHDVLEAARPWPATLGLRLGVGTGGDDDLDAAIGAADPWSGAVEVGLDDPALILYTSGTTGHPKGAVLTHGNLTWNTLNQFAHMDLLGSDRVLCFSPLFHVVGLGQITLPTLFKGGMVEVVAKFDPERILRLVHERRITAFSAVPTMLQMMCEHPAWAEVDLSCLRLVNYGGSPVPERVARAWLERGIQVVQGYGMTEASPGVYMAVQDGALERPVSIGLPHFFTDVAHVGEVPDGRGGTAQGAVPIVADARAELAIRGPHVFAGYFGRAAESAAVRLPGNWFRTGDVTRTATDGWSYAVDRVKDMIISGGENIYPAEVEEVLVQLPEVLGCAVVAVPDEKWGEVGAAYVQVRPDADLDLDLLRAHLDANLARYKIPKYLHLVDDLPRNATGKIQRAVLRTRATHDTTRTDQR